MTPPYDCESSPSLYIDAQPLWSWLARRTQIGHVDEVRNAAEREDTGFRVAMKKRSK
jgi:hypothetical protein